MVWGDFDKHVGKLIDGYEGVHKGEMLLEFCDEKELCVASTWFKKNEERKVTHRSEKIEQKLILC